MATWKQGGTGKGSDASRVDLDKYGEGLDRVKENKTEWITCSTCEHFMGGFDVLGNTLCSKVDRYNLNSKLECKEWSAR